jgi:hypothetical protein
MEGIVGGQLSNVNVAPHEFATTERGNVDRRQRKPLAVLPVRRESAMPVVFDTGGVVGLDRVNDLGSFWKLDP